MITLKERGRGRGGEGGKRELERERERGRGGEGGKRELERERGRGREEGVRERER